MKVDVRNLSHVRESQVQHAEERIAAALDNFEHRIQGVWVNLSDDHGKRHGQEMICQVRVQLSGVGMIQVEKHRSNLDAAIEDVADSLKRTVRRKLNRLRDTHRDHASLGALSA